MITKGMQSQLGPPDKASLNQLRQAQHQVSVLSVPCSLGVQHLLQQVSQAMCTHVGVLG